MSLRKAGVTESGKEPQQIPAASRLMQRKAAGAREAAGTKRGVDVTTSPRVLAQRRELQNAFGSALQRMEGPEEDEPLQGKFAPVQRRENDTGLPDHLKGGIEALSGLSMDHVRVHYNSTQPAQLNAHAYARGSDIHVAPGQEQHLPHEAWHLVQQAQGRVRPTMQLKDGAPINDDTGLEHEADVTGAKATQMMRASGAAQLSDHRSGSTGTVQRKIYYNNGWYTQANEAELRQFQGLPAWQPGWLASEDPYVLNQEGTGWTKDVPLDFRRFGGAAADQQKGKKITGASLANPLSDVGFDQNVDDDRIGPKRSAHKQVTKITIVKYGNTATGHWALQCEVAGGKKTKGMKIDLISLGYRIMYGALQNNPDHSRVDFTPREPVAVSRVYDLFVQIAKTRGAWTGNNRYNCQDFALEMLSRLSVHEEDSFREQSEWRAQTKPTL